MPKTIDDLLAEAQIKEVHLRFCRANDRRDEELMRSCFHADAVIELHEKLDLEAFLALGRAVLGRFTVTWHNTGNHRIAADGAAPERDMVAYGRYIDRMERRGGEWRFARRTYVLDFTRTDPNPASEPGFGARGGARDRSDPSYTLRPKK